VARGHGVSWDAIAGAIGRYRTLAMRWEERAVRGIRVVNDGYNANPVSMRAAVDAFRLLQAPGRKWLVLGGMLELGASSDEQHAALGRALADGGWAGLLAVGPLGRLIADGAREAGLDADRIACCADPAAAGLELAARARPGDAVLLKASRGIRIEGVIQALAPEAGAAPH
jgi:UDP-N-acetylmuramoyl-tripeptide--D-alanyl-D-alanine ligase